MFRRAVEEYALNEDSDVHEPARRFLESLAPRTDVVVVECRPVMERVWGVAREADFARRRIIDARLAFTLRSAGVTEFATRKTAHFAGFGFERVFDPLVPESSV